MTWWTSWQGLAIIYNKLESPLIWKMANVCPIFKKGTKGDPANYRPVSLTCEEALFATDIAAARCWGVKFVNTGKFKIMFNLHMNDDLFLSIFCLLNKLFTH